VYCSHCEKEVPDNNKFCKICGNQASNNPAPQSPPHSKEIPPSETEYWANQPPPNPGNYNQPPHNSGNYNQPPPNSRNYDPKYYAGYKSEGTTLVLAIIGGLLGFCGIGHMYVGKVGKGVVILIMALVLYAIGITTLFILVGIPFLIGGLAIFIWQIFDARKLCREYNYYLSNNGRPPW